MSTSRPKRRATNAHIFRYLQTRNPSKLEENDLKRALEASLEECPDSYTWPMEDSASCGSNSEQSNLTSATSSTSSSSSSSSSSFSRSNRNPTNTATATSQPLTTSSTNRRSVPSASSNRYKPVAKKNIYNEADFFHDGIMEYIEYQLMLGVRAHRNSNSGSNNNSSVAIKQETASAVGAATTTKAACVAIPFNS